MNANNHAAATLGKVRDNNGHNTKDNIDIFHDEVSLGCSIICTVVRTQANKTTVSTFAYWLVLSNCEMLLRLAAGNKTCLHVASDFINSSIVRARNGLPLDFINFLTMVSSTNAVTITVSYWISEEQDNCQGAITAGVSSDATKLLEKDRPEEIELQDQLPNSSQNLHSQLLQSNQLSMESDRMLQRIASYGTSGIHFGYSISHGNPQNKCPAMSNSCT